jgi:hypothetical protein
MFRPLPTMTVTPLPVKPTKTPASPQTALPFPSAISTLKNGQQTPSVPTLYASDENEIQCFKGPGLEYEPVYTFKTAEIIGTDETRLWWYLKMYDRLGKPISCWVNTQKTSTAGDLSSVSVTESETASVTAVNLSLVGDDTQTVGCNPNTAQIEFQFTGEIVANGPVKKLRYQWETNAGQKFAPEQAQVPAWDNPVRFKLNLPVPAQAGTYSLTLRTIYPNEIVSVVQFVVKCQ